MDKKLLILGDSFAASTHDCSWTQNLHGYSVSNLSACGSSEYRIVKTLNDLDVTKYHCQIVVHTSPNRIYTEQNPYYVGHKTHKNCDLIYQDMLSRLPDNWASHVTWWFENVFDLDQANFMHNLILDYAVKKLPEAIHITFFDTSHPAIHNLHHIWQSHPGNINHLTARGNDLVLEFLQQYL